MKEKAKSGRKLKPLQVGDTVRIQNQIGNQPKQWSNTGKVIEIKPHRQYLIMKDGSRRVTLRNRKFLRKAMDENMRRSIPNVSPTMSSKRLQSQETMDSLEGKIQQPQTAELPRVDILEMAQEPSDSPVQDNQMKSPNQLQSEVPASAPSPVVGDPDPVNSTTQGREGDNDRPKEAHVRKSQRQKSKPKRLIEEI